MLAKSFTTAGTHLSNQYPSYIRQTSGKNYKAKQVDIDFSPLYTKTSQLMHTSNAVCTMWRKIFAPVVNIKVSDIYIRD